MKLRIILIVDEEPYYHPDFVTQIIKNSKDEIIACGGVVSVPKKINLKLYLLKNITKFKIIEIIKFGLKIFKSFFNRNSVEKVCKKNGIYYFKIKDNINKREYLEKIREMSPDIIVSSNPLIFGEELLNIPKICCLNRHSSLLPSYGGILPIFHAMKNGEKKVGVSVHIMTPKLDKGKVIAQEAIDVSEDDTFDSLYSKCFKISASVVLKAIERIKDGGSPVEPVFNKNKPSYFSFPTAEDWKTFRKRGGKLI